MSFETSNLIADLHFDDPRLRMTSAGRFLVRIAAHIGYLLCVAAAAVALFSDILWLFWSGVFLTLFLLDRLIHTRDADRLIAELPQSGSVNVALGFTPASLHILERAYERSAFLRHSFFLEVLRELLRFREVREALHRLDADSKEFGEKLDDFLVQSVGSPEGSVAQNERLRQAEECAKAAFQNAVADRDRFVDVEDLFSVLPRMNDASVSRLFDLFSLRAEDVSQALLFGKAKKQFSFFRRLPKAIGGMVFGGERRIRHRVMNRAWTSRPTPTLDRYSDDLSDLARAGETGFLIGHEPEYKRLVETLARPTNPNAILVGEPGIGKETILFRLAFDLIKDHVPKALFDKRLVALRLEQLVASASEGELAARIKKVADEIMTAGNIILSVPDIHNLVHTSGTAYLSAADALMPIITGNTFPIVGTSYPREFKEWIEPRSDFSGMFEMIPVAEITESEARQVLVYESLLIEAREKIFISFGAIRTAVMLAKKYIRDKFLPSSAAELLKETVVAVQRKGEKFVGPEAVVAVAEEKVNVPIHEAGKAESESLLHLEETIHKRLVGQDEAVRAVADAIREYRSGLARPGGPIASFLFVGPTGVGKTELSKILAEIQFGSTRAMVRFDMTEYQDKQSFFRFIGSPDGKVSGALTEAIRAKPYSLILLDEFEKAFPDILNLFLQVLDDGRLTDNLGRTIDFQNTIVIATSNAHSDIVHEALTKGERMEEIAEYLKKRLTDIFRPELLNRFSRIIVFKDLSPAETEKIAALNLGDLAANVATQGITLQFDPEAVKKIAKMGYDPAFGARPLRRVIDEKVKAPLAGKILKKEIARGSVVKVILNGENLDFSDGGGNR